MTRACPERSIGLQNVSTKPDRPAPGAAQAPKSSAPARSSRRLLWCAALTLAAVSATLAACGGGAQRPPSPAVTPTATLSPVPADVAADLVRADGLYYEGDFEQALRLYSDAARAASGGQRLDALWRLAVATYARGSTAAAGKALEDLLAAGPDPDGERLALLLLGTVRLERGDDSGAEEALTRYVESDGPAASYAHLRLADVADRRGDAPGAVAHAQEAIDATAAAGAQVDARFALGEYQEHAGDAAGALKTYWMLAYGLAAKDQSDQAEALWRLADLAYRSKESALSAATLQRLIHEYPWHSRALEALEQPELIGSPPPVRDRALVLFRNRVNGDAEAAFQEALTDPRANLPEAHYYLGVLAERAGEPEAALAEYDASIALLGNGRDPTLLGQALWDRATVIEAAGSGDEAAAAYTATADGAPDSEHAAEALFRAGLIRYRQGLAPAAADLWVRYLDVAGDAESQARGHFWLSKAARDPAAAALEIDAAASADPSGYYGLRARALSRGAEFPAPAEVRPVAPDWKAVEEWLANWSGPEDIAVRDAFFAGPGWRRAVELQRAGLKDAADVEFKALMERAASSPWVLYRFARAVSDEGAAPVAARAAQRLAEGREGAPPDLLTLAYPPEYLDLANEYALAEGFSPLLLLALVRQESVYDPDAGSFAGASGLTQVIPGTAAQIASALGEAGFKNADLLRPRVSLRFGAYYLGEQVEGFGGGLPAALAAYNGGPGNAARWVDASGGDPDLFLESIDFSETRAYVELVLENYAQYLYAYGLVDEPSLPLP